VVHGIVQQAGGRIDVTSEIGKGTTFTILLPAAEGESASSGASENGATGGRERILLVEDEASLRLVASRALRGAGYSVLVASDGREALRIVAREAGHIDLVLTDVVMPGMGGRELADEIRRHLPRTRILFSSGYLDDAVVRHGVQQSAVAFLPKPYDSHSLLARVRDVLDRAGPGNGEPLARSA
jgi:CheY-like chemotaxis protein